MIRLVKERAGKRAPPEEVVGCLREFPQAHFMMDGRHSCSRQSARSLVASGSLTSTPLTIPLPGAHLHKIGLFATLRFHCNPLSYSRTRPSTRGRF